MDEIAVVVALNAGDRPALLRAEGRLGVIARSFARGNLVLVEACRDRFDPDEFPILGLWLRWMGRPETPAFSKAHVAEFVIRSSAGGPRLAPAELAARELEQLEGARLWSEWDAAMRRARAKGSWHPRLAIAEARALRVRDHPRALGALVAAFRHAPNHFTIAQMLGLEIVWSLTAELIGVAEAQEFWAPVAPLLKTDPDDLSLLGTEVLLRIGAAPDGVSIPEFTVEFDARRRRLLEEIASTP